MPESDRLHPTSEPGRPRRLLIVLPSWVGDTIMATPTLRVLRELLPGTLLGGLMRPGIDQLLAGTTFLDEVHVDRAQGMMGPKRVAARLRHVRYDAALLMTNSFSTALIARLAAIPRRIGYDRDGRGMLLTERLIPRRRREAEPYKRSAAAPNDWAPIPAVDYYFALARHLLRSCGLEPGRPGPMELGVTPAEELAADDLLERAGLTPDGEHPPALIMLNPGGNHENKRWPADRFAALACYLCDHHGVTVLLNGSPAEIELVDRIIGECGSRPVVSLPRAGISLAVLKALVRRCRLMVTNDTGPRHIAAALGVPVVTLFGPTDHRWTTIPFEDEVRLTADAELPEEEVANDHPERCRIDRIGLGDVVAATNSLLAGAAAR